MGGTCSPWKEKENEKGQLNGGGILNRPPYDHGGAARAGKKRAAKEVRNVKRPFFSGKGNLSEGGNVPKGNVAACSLKKGDKGSPSIPHRGKGLAPLPNTRKGGTKDCPPGEKKAAKKEG